MFEKKSEKGKQSDYKPREDGVELESQFIMRVPKVIGSSLKCFCGAGG